MISSLGKISSAERPKSIMLYPLSAAVLLKQRSYLIRYILEVVQVFLSKLFRTDVPEYDVPRTAS